MKTLTTFFLLFFLICNLPLFSFAQSKALIENLNVKNVNDSLLTISFDILKSKKNELFDIELIAKEQGKGNLQVRTTSGSFNNLKSGSHSITWDISKDIFDFNNFLRLQIFANSSLGCTLKSDIKLVKVMRETEYRETVNTDPNNENLAKITWIQPEKRSLSVENELLIIHACVSSEIKVKEINLFINNELISNDRAFKPISGDCPNTIRKEIKLHDGLNEIRLEIIDNKDIKTIDFLLIQKKI